MSGSAEQCLKSDLSFIIIGVSLHFTDDPQKTRVVQHGKIYVNFRSACIDDSRCGFKSESQIVFRSAVPRIFNLKAFQKIDRSFWVTLV